MGAHEPLTQRHLNRATLDRQLLLERHDLDPADAVRRILAVQAQAPASPYIALWSRLRHFDPAHLDTAITDAEVVKATLLRITLHLVHRTDHAMVQAAVLPSLRGARLGDRRFSQTGLTVDEADALVPDLLARLAEPHTNAQAEAWLAERVGDAAKWTWWALRQCTPLRHHPSGGPWSFGERPTHITAGPPPTDPRDRVVADAALAALTRRYLAAFGPASVADVAQFALVQRGRVRPLVEAMDDLVHLEGSDGVPLFDVADGVIPDPDIPAPPRLLAMWDSILLAHHDRTRVLPEHLRRVVIQRNGDVLASVLVDGQVAGVWRTICDAEGAPAIEVTAFHPLDEATWDALSTEATSLLGLIGDRDPQVYRRYDRWWDQLSAHDDTQVRVLGASHPHAAQHHSG